jgi:hypothetical protein
MRSSILFSILVGKCGAAVTQEILFVASSGYFD